VAAFASVALYTAFYVGEAKLAAGTLYAVVGTFSAIWALSSSVLMLTMERKYVRTFFSTETGCERVMNQFLDNAGDDELRAEICTNNEEMWRPIRDQVQAWVRSRFRAWKTERPAWFTDAVCASIPTDMLPPRDARRLTKQAGGQRTTSHNAGLAHRLSLSLSVLAPAAAARHNQVAPTGPAPAELSDSDSDSSRDSDSDAEAQQPPDAAESRSCQQ
jgi:hypothetical protein